MVNSEVDRKQADSHGQSRDLQNEMATRPDSRGEQ